mgnify:CR=1 FL=1
MKFSALASGSSGNCFYIEHNSTAVLVDAGISCRKILEKLDQISASPEKIRAIFITHEHSDHNRGADVLARKLNIPIFATPSTISSAKICSKSSLMKKISPNEKINIGDLKIKALSKSHEAADPVSFIIEGDKKVSVITDLGFTCKNTCSLINQSHAIFLESNYDLKMLENGDYPYYLKKLIKSDIGHLSNEQASLGILLHATPKLKTIVLSHLSENNNHPDIALNTLTKIITSRKDISPRIIISGRHEPTELMEI